jgi:hypothetical protein
MRPLIAAGAVVVSIAACGTQSSAVGTNSGGTTGGGPQNQASPFLGQWSSSGNYKEECADGSTPKGIIAGTITLSASSTSSNDFVLSGSLIQCSGEVFTVSGDLASVPPGTTCNISSKDSQGFNQTDLYSFTQDTITLLTPTTLNQAVTGTDDYTSATGAKLHCVLNAIVGYTKIH